MKRHSQILGIGIEVPHLFRVATRQHLGHQVIIIGRLVARMGTCKPVPVLSKDLLEDVPVPRGLCQPRVAPTWGVRLFAVKRLSHGSSASSTPSSASVRAPSPASFRLCRKFW